MPHEPSEMKWVYMFVVLGFLVSMETAPEKAVIVVPLRNAPLVGRSSLHQKCCSPPRPLKLIANPNALFAKMQEDERAQVMAYTTNAQRVEYLANSDITWRACIRTPFVSFPLLVSVI